MGGTGDGRTVPPAPTGRAAELELISAFLRRSADAGAALLLSGEPGIGKTLLLDVAAEIAGASGTVVVRGCGARSEADVAFGALNQVLLPLARYPAVLRETHRRALPALLGLGKGAPPDRLAASAAVIELLRQVSDASPVLIVIDDLQLLDQPSAGVLSFVARRVSGNRIGFLAASRRGDETFFDASGIPVHDLAPLAEDAAEKLLVSRFPGLAARVRARIRAEARGNPLALLELPAALSGPQRAGSVVLPSALPLTPRLLATFSASITGLPAAARRRLLLAALDRTGDARVLAAVGEPPSGDGLVATAGRAGLLHLDDDQHRFVFGQPLVRACVIELALEEERRAAHRELAALFSDDPDVRVWHLAAAERRPGERLAPELEHAAQRILRTGDAAGAMATMTRASELSQDPAERGRRLARAAITGVGVAGDRQSAAWLLASALRHDGDLRDSLEAETAAAYLLISGEGEIDAAHGRLVRAIEAATDTDRGTVLEVALYGLMLICFFGGRAELWQPFHRAISRLGPQAPDLLQVCSETFADPVSATGPALERLSTAIESLAHEANPIRIVRVGFAAAFVDRSAECRAALRRVACGGRDDGGAVVSAILALNMLGAGNFQTGQWDLAAEQAAESIGLCEDRDYMLLAWPARFTQAALAAARGDFAVTRALTDQMLSWATPRLVRAVQCYAWQVRALAAAGSGDFEEAYRCASQIAAPGHLPAHVPHALYSALDLVESCARTGRRAEATAHVAAMEAAGIAAISPRLRLVVSGCKAFVTSDAGAARDLFAEALAVPGTDRWPFELARIQLLYGERLRRAWATRESRAQLNAAFERFQWLGARPWQARARDELRLTGQTKVRDAPDATGPLTAREHQIATLAASGLRNKDIAERLCLSERTVGTHLRHAFPKLGVTSRAALRDALASDPDGAAS